LRRASASSGRAIEEFWRVRTPTLTFGKCESIGTKSASPFAQFVRRRFGDGGQRTDVASEVLVTEGANAKGGALVLVTTCATELFVLARFAGAGVGPPG
jgi:hypothetical protein